MTRPTLDCGRLRPAWAASSEHETIDLETETPDHCAMVKADPLCSDDDALLLPDARSHPPPRDPPRNWSFPLTWTALAQTRTPRSSKTAQHKWNVWEFLNHGESASFRMDSPQEIDHHGQSVTLPSCVCVATHITCRYSDGVQGLFRSLGISEAHQSLKDWIRLVPPGSRARVL